jgi:energy-converting hydrogenase Eha subunit C
MNRRSLFFILSVFLLFAPLINATTFISLPNISTSHYSSVALIIFSIGLLLFILVLLFLFEVFILKGNFLNGIAIFSLAMISFIFLIVSGSYTQISTSTAYSINSASGNYLINSTSVSSIPLSTNQLFGIIITAISIMDAILSLISLVTFIFIVREQRRKKKYADE